MQTSWEGKALSLSSYNRYVNVGYVVRTGRAQRGTGTPCSRIDRGWSPAANARHPRYFALLCNKQGKILSTHILIYFVTINDEVLGKYICCSD